jgi:hypothetical protein
MFGGGRPGYSPTNAEVRASSLRTPHAVRSQAPAKPGAELPWLRRADVNTFQAGSGRLITRIYSTPINLRTDLQESLDPSLSVCVLSRLPY